MDEQNQFGFDDVLGGLGSLAGMAFPYGFGGRPSNPFSTPNSALNYGARTRIG